MSPDAMRYSCTSRLSILVSSVDKTVSIIDYTSGEVGPPPIFEKLEANTRSQAFFNRTRRQFSAWHIILHFLDTYLRDLWTERELSPAH